MTLPAYNITTLSQNTDRSYNSFNDITYYHNRNDYRMPNYHRLDIGMNFHKVKKHGIRTWNISCYNVYSRSNAFFLYPDKDDNGQNVLKQATLFRFTPSVSYNFKF